MLRTNYSLCMQQLMRERGADPAAVKTIVDLGCATGLSSLALMEAFPGAAITGVDLSPYFLAVGRYEQREREVSASLTPWQRRPSSCRCGKTSSRRSRSFTHHAHRPDRPDCPPAPQAASGKPEPLTFVHAPAEATGLPAGSQDLVSMCLVAHELPQSATRAILREAFR
jgi:ubiquinone/menaquinone biosynthesis C-methylase UbiE